MICIYDGLYSEGHYCCSAFLLFDCTFLFSLEWFLSWYFELEFFRSNSSTLCHHLTLLWKMSYVEGVYVVPFFGCLIVSFILRGSI